MDALAAEGVRFENAFAQVPMTLPSHGLPPNIGMIAEAFQRQGTQTAAFVSAFVVDSTWGFGRGFETYDDHFDPRQFETRNPGNVQRRADETIDRVLAWLDARDSSGKSAQPFFVWLHLFDPHSDYSPPEPFRSRYAGRLYDGEVAYTDSQLARLLSYLRKKGIYDRTLIVLLSDHGESLGEHGEDEHGFFIYNATIRVPMILKLPRGMAPPRVVRQPVGTVSIPPTLLDLLRIRDPISRQFQGRSLASLVLGKRAGGERPVYAESYFPHHSFGWSPLRSITARRFRYIEAPKPEVYDLSADPAERNNLYTKRQAEAAAWRTQLSDFERRYAAKSETPKGPALSAETLEKLKSLGYVGYSGPKTGEGVPEGLPDPKDRIKVYRLILRAQDLASTGRIEESNGLLRSAAREEPDLYLIPFMLAENATRIPRWAEAEKYFLDSLKLNPSFTQAIMGLARSLVSQGKSQEARPWFELAIHENPHNFLAYHGLGLVARREGRKEEAQQHFLKTIKEKPNYAPSHQELGIVLVEMRQYAEALEPLTKAAELGSQNAILANYLGTAYVNTNRVVEGIQSYQKALELKSDYAPARLNLAFAYLKLGERANAKRQFQALCRQNQSLCQKYRSRFE
jgi:arylsulfatase A-like enzyme/Flp pilus assembly protein TadD